MTPFGLFPATMARIRRRYRVLTTMAGELLATAAQREVTQHDERLYLELFGALANAPRQRA
ncbi:MAG: hypothetical protein OXC05_10840 [Halieaceae bacterium]|nr:hypothetical protein [Halieaceae bacterium]